MEMAELDDRKQLILEALGREIARQAETDLKEIDLVALATVCDVVPLKGLNRAFVARGLEVARTGSNRGIGALHWRRGSRGRSTRTTWAT